MVKSSQREVQGWLCVYRCNLIFKNCNWIRIVGFVLSVSVQQTGSARRRKKHHKPQSHTETATCVQRICVMGGVQRWSICFNAGVTWLPDIKPWLRTLSLNVKRVTRTWWGLAPWIKVLEDSPSEYLQLWFSHQRASNLQLSQWL